MVQRKPSLHNRLYVEGKTDRFVIAELAEANGILWNDRHPPIDIQFAGSKEVLKDSDYIQARLSDSGIQAIGIVIDADDDPAATWMSLRNACLKIIPNFPETLPPTGLIHTTPDGIQFGIWMMPDNQFRGMLETFLAYLVTQDDPLWQYAQSTVNQAKTKAAPFKPTHQDKANIHTWLAWQNEPGQQLHTALQTKILNPQHPKAQEFADWLKRLYHL